MKTYKEFKRQICQEESDYTFSIQLDRSENAKEVIDAVTKKFKGVGVITQNPKKRKNGTFISFEGSRGATNRAYNFIKNNYQIHEEKLEENRQDRRDKFSKDFLNKIYPRNPIGKLTTLRLHRGGTAITRAKIEKSDATIKDLNSALEFMKKCGFKLTDEYKEDDDNVYQAEFTGEPNGDLKATIEFVFDNSRRKSGQLYILVF